MTYISEKTFSIPLLYQNLSIWIMEKIPLVFRIYPLDSAVHLLTVTLDLFLTAHQKLPQVTDILRMENTKQSK